MVALTGTRTRTLAEAPGGRVSEVFTSPLPDTAPQEAGSTSGSIAVVVQLQTTLFACGVIVPMSGAAVAVKGPSLYTLMRKVSWEPWASWVFPSVMPTRRSTGAQIGDSIPGGFTAWPGSPSLPSVAPLL